MLLLWTREVKSQVAHITIEPLVSRHLSGLGTLLFAKPQKNPLRISVSLAFWDIAIGQMNETKPIMLIGRPIYGHACFTNLNSTSISCVNITS